MSNKKKMIFFGIIFVLCIGLIIFTYKTKNIEKNQFMKRKRKIKIETEKENRSIRYSTAGQCTRYQN